MVYGQTLASKKMEWPSTDAFNAAVLDNVAQANPTLKWRDLGTERIYCITKVRWVKTKFGDSASGRLALPDGWERDVWLPAHPH